VLVTERKMILVVGLGITGVKVGPVIQEGSTLGFVVAELETEASAKLTIQPLQ
jgi:hypothetical protein